MKKELRAEWPGVPGRRPVATVGDVAKIWMSDPGPVAAEYARAFGLTSSDARALREVVRRCDHVGGEDVAAVAAAARPLSPRRGRRQH